jgi:putative transposase
MTLFRNRYRVESARLKGYDYSSPGEYFLTIDTKGMVEWFGKVEKGEMIRNEIGEKVYQLWLTIPQHHENVMLDEFVVMPNHIHGILVLSAIPRKDVARDVSTKDNANFMSTISPKRGSLSTIIGSHKSAVTKWCHDNSYDDFQWQPRFHDHIIRNERQLYAIREYIRDNPARWEEVRGSSRRSEQWMD